MPLCPRRSKKTTSPGCRLPRLTGEPRRYWASALCGSVIPFLPYTNITKPEQSNPDGEVPPRAYGAPTYLSAVATRRACADDGRGAGRGAADTQPVMARSTTPARRTERDTTACGAREVPGVTARFTATS